MQIKLKKWNKNTGTVYMLILATAESNRVLLMIIVSVVICNKLIKLFSLNQRDAIHLHLNLNKSKNQTNETQTTSIIFTICDHSVMHCVEMK